MTNDMAAGRLNPNWTGTNIFSMVLGFVLFWPVGLVFLYMILTGRDIPNEMRRGWHWLRSRVSGHGGGMARAFSTPGGSSGNRVFDDHLRAEYARLELEKRRLEDEKQAFAEFLDQIGQDRDRQIFNQWRAARETPDTTGA